MVAGYQQGIAAAFIAAAVVFYALLGDPRDFLSNYDSIYEDTGPFKLSFSIGAVGFTFLMISHIVLAAKVRQAFSDCVKAQEKFLKSLDVVPDIVVGSSFGGAITLELVARGAWRGPTLLLAPAQHSILRKIVKLKDDVIYPSMLSGGIGLTAGEAPALNVIAASNDAFIPVSDCYELVSAWHGNFPEALAHVTEVQDDHNLRSWGTASALRTAVLNILH